MNEGPINCLRRNSNTVHSQAEKKLRFNGRRGKKHLKKGKREGK